jgi:hypothetical protein
MAFVYDALGRTEEALRELQRALTEGSPHLFLLDVDPRMDGLRSHACFKKLRDQVFHGVASAARAAVPAHAGETTQTHRAAI